MSRRRRIRRSRRGAASRIAVRALTLAVAVAAVLSAAGVTVAYGLVETWLKDLPDYESPSAFRVAQPTRIYSADGKLLARLYLENRIIVPYDTIAQGVKDGVVAVEDERYYQHRGVDLVGVARAAVKDVIAGGVEEGASTITQQYVRNTVLSHEQFDVTFARKVREIYVARELEKRKSKDEILNLYLNTVYFGEGAYGAEAAARTYFAKSAKDLTLAEAAMLAGLPQAPSRLDPYDNPEGALTRRTEVLGAMLDNGYITREEHDAAKDEPVKLGRMKEPPDGIYQAHYFVAHVKKVLQQEYDQAIVFRGGLKVYTTLDTKRQKYAEDAVFGSLNRAGDPDCSLVSIDPRNGHVVAMVGGRDFSRNKFNLATQGRRQPGSAFKTFVLVTALEQGMPPNRYIDGSSPAVIQTGGRPWRVTGGSGGYITMETATRNSVNAAYARLIKEVGPDKVAITAKRMGITTKIPAYYSIALGSQNVTCLEMASAYGTLATNGVHYEPSFITRVLDADDQTVFEEKPKGRQALTPAIAYAATRILKGVITGGTARSANIGRPAAGKTGTSQDHRDAWFVGYTPQLVTAVWVGYYQREIPMYTVHGIRGYGGKVAAPIWARYMRAALATEPRLDFKAVAAPKYKWKKSWSARATTESVTPTKTVTPTKPKPKPVPEPTSTPPPPPPPPPPPDPTGTPTP